MESSQNCDSCSIFGVHHSFFVDNEEENVQDVLNKLVTFNMGNNDEVSNKKDAGQGYLKK